MNKPRSTTKKSKQNQQSVQAVSVLNELGEMVTAIQDPTKVLKQIATEAMNILEADTVDLYEYNQARQEFVLPPTLVGKRSHPEFFTYKVHEDDVIVKVVQSGESLYFPDSQQDPLLIADFDVRRSNASHERFVIREMILSSAAILLRAGKEVVGVLFVNYRTRQKFEDERKDLIVTFSNLAAIAIHNARLWKFREAQLIALKEIINVTGTKEDPLPTILEKAVALFSADNGLVSTLTDDGQSLEHKVRSKDGKLEVVIKEPPLPISKGVIGYVIRIESSFRTGDVSQVEFYDPWSPTTKSELAIPLKNVFGGIIGVLNLESNSANFFTEEDEKLGESFANAASAAIQQSALVEDMQAFHYLTESHSLKDLIKKILENLTRRMGENTATSINLYDSKRDIFYAFDGVGLDQKFIDEYLLIPPRENGTGRYVLRTKTPLFYEDVNNIPAGLPKIRGESKKHQIVSFAVLPLIYQDDVIGTLFIQKIKDHIKFTEDVKRILVAYASQAALAIHNAQRLVSVDLLDTLLKATVKESEPHILNLVVEEAVAVMGADYASIWLGESRTGDLVRRAIYIKPEEKEYLIAGIERIKRDVPSINMDAFKKREAIIVGDVDQAEKEGRYYRIYKRAKSELTVPLTIQDEVIGTLNIESQFSHAFSDIDRVTLRVFADIAAVAIKVVQDREEINKEVQRKTEEIRKQSEELKRINSQISVEVERRTAEVQHMNYRLERRNASFEVLTEIGQQLTANVQRGEHEILSIIHQQASRIMDTNNMYIALYEPEKDAVYFELAFIDGEQVDVQNEPQWAPRSGGKGRTEWIIRNKTSILTYAKVDADKWYQQPGSQNYLKQTFASWLGVPIMFGNEVLGVIATYNKAEEFKYDPDDEKILILMGRQAAIALQNARLIGRLDAMRELGEDLSSSLSIQ
jgi:GAF domain-containing protein